MIKNKRNTNYLTKQEIVEVFKIINKDGNSAELMIDEFDNFWEYHIEIRGLLYSDMLKKLSKLDAINNIYIYAVHDIIYLGI